MHCFSRNSRDAKWGMVCSFNCVPLITPRSMHSSDPDGSPIIPLVSSYSCMSCHNILDWQYLVRINAAVFVCCLRLSCGEETKIDRIFSQRSPLTLKKCWLFFFVAVQAFNLSSTLVEEFSHYWPSLRWMSWPLITWAQADLPVDSPRGSS